MSAEQALRAEVIAALRTESMSQAEAARRLGLSNKYVNQMLTGRATLTLVWAERLLALCGLRVVVGVQGRRRAGSR